MILGKSSVFGLDIGSNSIKLIELKLSKNGYQLKNIGVTSLPPQSIVNKAINNHDAVADSISSLLEDLRIKTKNVVISVSGNSVIIKKVTLPKMSDNELVESIPWELEQYIPQSINDVNYDYQVLPGETPEGNMDVLIVAAKKDITDDYISVASAVGLNPVMVDVDVFALENMYEINYFDTNGILALANIGASITNINILSNGISVFTRDINTGGNQFTEWISKELNTDFEEAEKMKFNIGNGNGSGDVNRIANDFSDLICGEIKRTIDFFSSTLTKDKIERIMIGGGSSLVPSIGENLEEMTETKVEVINPFNNIDFNTSEFDSEYLSATAPKMCVAVGLALRRPGDKQ